MIAKSHKSNRYLAVAASLWAGFGLLTLANAQTEKAEGPPHIISTSPKTGATDIDPALKEVTVTFDRDMDGGMSWTGGGSSFPKSPEGADAHWKSDKRTCILPVKLQPGHFYRVGINAPSYHNFRAEDGTPVTPSAITFRTTGTPVAPKAPRIVSLNPANGASEVSPAVTELRVTFDIPMGGGMSWCGSGPNFPTIPEGKKAYWTKDGKTCVLPVELKPNWEYQLGLNSPSFKNFKSEDGLPLSPVGYTFKTTDKP
jgi:RNA polymerase sigma-70 factor (ECF subfamily)